MSPAILCPIRSRTETVMLHFEVQTKQGQRSDYSGTVVSPSVFPSFVLVFNDDWNDYSYYTWFCLYYFDEHEQRHKIGELKLMKRGEADTFDILDKSFDGPLDTNFCSLGIEPRYYSEIYRLFHDTPIANELLVSLRDCAYDHNIYEAFCEDEIFKTSLLREDSSQQAVWEATFLLSGKNKHAAYSFSLHFAPEYLGGAFTDWDVPLIYDALPFMRTVGLIGNNGVGKTQMLKMLIANLVNDVPQPVSLPLFRSCLAISSTPFDGYDKIVPARPRIPYQYFSIEQDAKYTPETIFASIEAIYHRPLIHRKPMIQLYKESVDALLGKQVGAFLKYNEGEDNYDLDKDYLHEQINIMSSGQLHIFNLLTFIHAHIHLSSLLVIDEPEVHMHPQIIASFMTMLGTILQRFRSYAIIATHSPLIVREMVGQNVYLMRLVDGGIPNVAKVAFETFGADASELFMQLFQFDERMSSFYHYVKILARKKDYQQVLALFERYAPGLSLNARLSIRDYFEDIADA